MLHFGDGALLCAGEGKWERGVELAHEFTAAAMCCALLLLLLAATGGDGELHPQKLLQHAMTAGFFERLVALGKVHLP